LLTPSQLADLKRKDPELFELLRSVVGAVNTFGVQMGVDPKPANQVDVAIALPAPRAPKSITVLVASPVVFVTLEPSPDATASAFYFVERSASAQFTAITRYALGHGLHLAAPEDVAPSFWRCFAKYQMSGPSPFTGTS